MTGAGYVFEEVKEHRGSYFVQYMPARAGEYFASLALVFMEKPIREEIPMMMERESKAWIEQYPVPLMTTAFDDKDDVISLEDLKGCDHLIGLPQEDAVVFHWKFRDDDEFASGTLKESQLLEIYRNLPHTTQAERVRATLSKAKAFRLGLVIIALWGVVVPIAVALVGFSSPILGGIIITYSVGEAVWRAMKMLGYVDRSKREKKKAEKELRMRHHHYHCERNPEGFLRLKVENFEREAKEQLQREAEELKRLQSKAGGGV